MSTILVISFSDLARDPRVDRQIAFLKRHWTVIAAGLGEPAHDVPYVPLGADPVKGRETPLSRLHRLGLIALRRHEAAYWASAEVRRAFHRLRGLSPDLIVANEIAALPLALRLAGGRARVLFDAHEYAPGEFDDFWWWRLLFGAQAADLCRRHIPRADAMTTVSHGIAERYAAETGMRPLVIWNAPFYAELQPQPVGDRLRMTHFGWADPTRRIEEMIELMRFLDDRFTLDLILVPTDRRYLERLHRAARGDDRIRFLPPVPMRELVQSANGYDIGLYLLNADNFNRRFALPNKIFEFVQARLAVAVGPSPEMARLVREHDLGVVAADHQPQTLAARLSELDRDRVYAFKQRAHAAATSLCAERQGEHLTERIGELLELSSSTPMGTQPTAGR